ncbi:hypothetical protein EVAR_26638_1 [Eumeta japonica]|uniref:Uncharacterized protein n=1 Tax=Eumeta variegata TaxID=151549 RepID=A0A4C1VKP1_EUMVA|nr:hypothetical protein EVAR_26638_1 [Eumeta japonica]
MAKILAQNHDGGGGGGGSMGGCSGEGELLVKRKPVQALRCRVRLVKAGVMCDVMVVTLVSSTYTLHNYCFCAQRTPCNLRSCRLCQLCENRALTHARVQKGVPAMTAPRPRVRPRPRRGCGLISVKASSGRARVADVGPAAMLV